MQATLHPPQWVYPRVYGGTWAVPCGSPRYEPSPWSSRKVYPRVYGGTGRHLRPFTQHPTVYPRVYGGTHRASTSIYRVGVYPRVYGGTSGYLSSHLSRQSWGLSPRVRGNPRLFIRRLLWQPEVYPRVYGGTTWGGRIRFRLNGLSPRVRGNLGMGAGPIPWQRVYPRVYGGTSSGSGPPQACTGLSPRVPVSRRVTRSIFSAGRSVTLLAARKAQGTVTTSR